MLEERQFGPVRYFRMGRSFLGRTIITSGVYVVDGLMIDTGPASCGEEFGRVLDSVGLETVVLTHHHEDHVGNAARAARILGEPPLAHAASAPYLRQPPELPFYRRLVWGDPEPVTPEALGEELRFADCRFEVLHLPGHAPDHVALHEPRRGWLFSGDLYLGDRPKLLRDDEDVSGILDSLRRLLRLPECTLFCQHSGRHESHQQRLGRKLDYLLGLQEKAVVYYEEGRRIPEIARELDVRQRFWEWVSRGEFSGRNLVRGLLVDAGVDPEADPTIADSTDP